MEQILAVLTLYLATVRLGTVACKTAPQRLIMVGRRIEISCQRVEEGNRR